jgi:hypothetical protein
MYGERRNGQIIAVLFAFLAVIVFFGSSAAEGRHPSPAAIETSMDHAIYFPLSAGGNNQAVLWGRVKAEAVCSNCCSLITLKARDSVYELLPGESFAGDLAVYHDFFVQIHGEYDGFCGLNGRPVVKVSSISAIPPFPLD